MMFFARIVPGRKPEVWPLTGALFAQHPKSWQFCSYRKGACAVDYTRDLALRAAWTRMNSQPQLTAVAPVPVRATALRIRTKPVAGDINGRSKTDLEGGHHLAAEVRADPA